MRVAAVQRVDGLAEPGFCSAEWENVAFCALYNFMATLWSVFLPAETKMRQMVEL